MTVQIKGRNIEITPSLREYLEKKLVRVSRIYEFNNAVATLNVEKEDHKVEITVPLNGYILRAEDTQDDMYAAIDLVADKLEKQLVKYKEKLTNKNKKQKAQFEQAQANFDDSIQEDALVRIKKFPVKPMTVDEAIMQMNLLGHNFFVFTNAETESVNVIYVRKDGKYAMLEPEY